jgi:hypothetical protein
MLSEKQLEANRANAQKSTGPRTEEGKRRSSLNATRHGLTGQVVILPEESLQAFNEFTRPIVEALLPADAAQQQLAQSYANFQWRINRSQAIEENVFTLGNIHDVAGNLDLEHPEAHNAMCDAKTFIQEGKTIDRISIYSARLVRQATAVLKQLKDLQADLRRREEDETYQAVKIYQAHKAAGAIFEPAQIGFVLTIPKIEARIARVKLQDVAEIRKLMEIGAIKAA